MTEIPKPKKYDLEERTFKFTQAFIRFANTLPGSVMNKELVKQVVRSAGSVGANYIGANESLSKKDFGMRVKICRKEAKETEYWLRLISAPTEDKQQALIQEATELRKIFGSIVEKIK